MVGGSLPRLLRDPGRKRVPRACVPGKECGTGASCEVVRDRIERSPSRFSGERSYRLSYLTMPP